MRTSDLDRYSFIWSELRLLLAALALFQGGVPVIYLMLPKALISQVQIVLICAWIMSGLASGYLLYRWYQNGKVLFGRRDRTDAIAFLVLALSGLNLGFAGVTGANIGMGILSGRLVFIITGILYIYSAWHLWMHSKSRGGLF